MWVLIITNAFSIVYLRFQNYYNTDAIFISDTIVLFAFLMKNIKVVESFADHFQPFSSLLVRHGARPAAQLVALPSFLVIHVSTYIQYLKVSAQV
jgi:hypothetical protein